MPEDGSRGAGTAVPDTRLGSYLRAVRCAADQQPYPGLAVELDAPPLADVYVPRRAESRSGRAQAPAEHVFTAESRLRVLLAGPGHGKSTLLRHHLASASRHLLHHRAEATTTTDPDPVLDSIPVLDPIPVPVLIRATELVASPLLAPALAAAVTEALGPFGLREALAEDFFRRRPHPGAPWLVMVDGLDEVPDRTARLSLLDRLAREAAHKDSPYRFLIATRPLPGGELDRLDQAVDRFTLQPFTDADVRTYAEKRFSSLPDADRHVRAFANGIRRTRLEGLACIPLMTAMLCHLYAADVD
ncbi:NACHT domain-containing protein [Streptomyces sp. NPDC060028]|uniref:NACHT domain-containing protein n=1 Tax=Streptomyces sp. NPDC060028 TaxID=3347041 RepID=UPI0036C74342